MSNQKIVVFDIIGTCFSLSKPQQQLIKLGAPQYALELWFAQALRDGFGFSHSGGYKPLKEILKAELPRTLKLLDISVNSTELTEVMETFSELELQPSAEEAFDILAQEGWKIVALTNGSEKSTRNLLERVGMQKYFSQIYSCDEIAITKPHPDVYKMIEADNLENVWLVAAHAWDIAGAKRVGMKTAFVQYVEKDYLEVYPQPTIICENLAEAARQIVNSL